MLVSLVSILCRPSSSEINCSYQELNNKISDLELQLHSDTVKIKELEFDNQRLLQQNDELKDVLNQIYNCMKEFL